MLKHVVIWNLKDEAEGADKASNALKAKALLDACKGLVPGQHAFEVATNAAGLGCTADLILYSEFEDEAALKAYQMHPTHVALKPFLAAIVSGRQCMDYTTS
jgi:hypothetical protein